MTNSPGWAVQLVGEKVDLDDLRDLLKQPFDPWVEEYETDDGMWILLRSANWHQLAEAGDVRQDAARLTELLNGQARLIHGDARPVKLGQLLKFDAAGKSEPIIFATTGQLRVTLGRVRARITAATSGAPNPPEESKLQRWLREADSEECMAELFLHLSRMDNWFDLYKSMELAQRAKGDVKTILGPVDWKQWRDIRQTANCHRHAPDIVKYRFPTDPPSLEDSIEYVLKAIARLLS